MVKYNQEEVLKLKSYFDNHSNIDSINTNTAYEHIRLELGIELSSTKVRYLKKSYSAGCIMDDGTIRRVANSRTTTPKPTKKSDSDVISALEQQNRVLLDAIKHLPNNEEIIRSVMQSELEQIDVHVEEYRAKLVGELYTKYGINPPQ